MIAASDDAKPLLIHPGFFKMHLATFRVAHELLSDLSMSIMLDDID